MEYYSAIKKNAVMPFAASWRDPEIIILNQVRQRQISYDITYKWNLKNDSNELIYKTEIRRTDTENKLMGTKGDSGDRKDKLEVWD